MPLLSLGEAVKLIVAGDGPAWACQGCGRILGPGHQDFRRLAVIREVGLDTYSPWNRFAADSFVLREFCCPGCGRLLDVQPRRRKDPTMYDSIRTDSPVGAWRAMPLLPGDAAVPYNPHQHHRRSIRLAGYDYTQPGAYFVTICVHHKACLFGDVNNAEMRVNALGSIVHQEWEGTARARENVTLDAFIVMPNHVHAVIWLTDRGGMADAEGMARHAPTFSRPIADSLATIVGAFKSATSRRINKLRGTPGSPVWQRNYYERVVRGDEVLYAIREYIAANPAQWAQDPENPSATP